MKTLLTSFFVSVVFALQAQITHTHIADRAIDFPDIPGYLTLKTDLHQHTVFSDGNVWPIIRIQEAIRDGLDVVSLTEHLEYLPHRDDIPLPDHNRSYQIASKSAEESELLVIRGSEITRKMPPGHSNAIFIQDANKLIQDDPMDVFEEAHNQGAFIFWNHPNWTSQTSDGIAELHKIHNKLISKGYLNGIEVVNETTYSEEALQIALDNNLTIMGTSDIHDLIDWRFNVPEGGHRPVTLVFAKEKTESSVKEALFARRTAVWFNNTLIGREEMLLPLIKASVTVVDDAAYGENTEVLIITLKNASDASFILYNKTGYTFHANDDVIILEPHSLTTLQVKTKEKVEEVNLKFNVLNAVTAPDTHPDIVWQIKVKEVEENK
ncbi:MAG: PHP domain-containing protein [Bacteroidetes bacterium]|nr:MAG: PHP domain-containing protein [Bacteroidota bacterium]